MNESTKRAYLVNDKILSTLETSLRSFLILQWSISAKLTQWTLARPAPNKFYNLLGTGLARAQQVLW
jgi:hypothetical protein